MDEPRIARLEDEIAQLARRVALLERPAPMTRVQERPAVEPAARPASEHPPRVIAAAPAPAPGLPPAPGPTLRERLGLAADDGLEDLFGGRVLAWVGGLAVLLGLVFLLAIAMSNGWIGEGARTLLAALGSAGLLGAGVRLHGRGARTDAARAAASAGIAGLFLTITVASQVYELVPSLLGTGLSAGVGALATALAVRWQSRGVAALGILGAVAAPLLAGAQLDAGAVAILFVALAAAAGVLLWQRWDWLALAAFGVGAPQWIASLLDGASPMRVLVTLVAFGALGVVVALGRDLRTGPQRLRSEPAFLLALNAVVLAVAGWAAFASLGDPTAGKAWLAGLALVHLAVGLAGSRLARGAVSKDLERLSLVLGVVLADVAFALVTDGLVLTLGWTATSVAFAALLRGTARRSRDEALAGTGLGGHLALALVTALTVAQPFDALEAGGVASVALLAALGAVAAGCLISARLVEDGRAVEWRVVLDGLGLATVALLTALTLDDQKLVLALAGEAATLAAIARRRGDVVAGCGALGFLGLAALHGLAVEAPPVALVTGLLSWPAAVLALGAVAGASLSAAARLRGLWPQAGPLLQGAAAVALLYLASGLVVTVFEHGSAVDSALLGSHQQGQVALSVLWALVGVGALLAGLRRDVAVLRLAALGLLGVTVTKVFLLDFATLTSLYRAVSFVALGLLLLLGAFAWQRVRAQPAAGGSSSS